MWASSGPFPLSAHYGLYKRGRDPPTNPSRHLKKERSPLPLKWLLKEDQGRRPTAASAAVPAAETAVSPCFGHVLPTQSTLHHRCRRRRRCRKAVPPPLLPPSFPTNISPQSAPLEISRPISPRPTFCTLRSHPSHDPTPVPNVPSILNSHCYVFYLPSTPSFHSFLSTDQPLPHLTFHFPKSHPHTATILPPLLPTRYPTLHLPLLLFPSDFRPTA